MSVKTLRQSSLRQAQNKIYDAIIKAKILPGATYSDDSIKIETAENGSCTKAASVAGTTFRSNNLINITIPRYSELETPNATLKGIYLDAFKLASSMGYKSVVTEVIYGDERGVPFKGIFNTAMRAASAADNVEKCHLNIFIAVDNDIQEQVKKSLPKDLLVRKPNFSLDRFNSPSSASNSFMVMEALYRRVDDNGYKIEVEVPDELERALKSADYQDYYPEDETATGVLYECLGKHEMSKSAIQMELIEYLGKSTVYNALNPKYTKKALDKKTIVYVALAMGMDLLETKRALNAAHHKFIPKDPIDMVYAYAINHHLNVDDMRDILFVKNLLEYEN